VIDHCRFYFQRDEDVSGISGTGRVADGCLWTDGAVSIRWRGEARSFVNFEEFAKSLQVHGHGGKTRLVWLDQLEGPAAIWARDIEITWLGAA
jgi:hypothetical protein